MAGDRASEPEAEPSRLFVAVAIPERAADAIRASIGPWRSVLPSAWWVPRENWHVTLRFLGATDPVVLPWVGERLGDVAAATPAFETRVHGLGAFPSGRRARVLWAGLDDPEERFAALAHAVERSLAREFRAEAGRFTPHVTIARTDPPLALPDGFGETPLASEPFPIDAVVLMRSHLRRPVPVYETLETFSLVQPIV